jgi:RNA polymerase primary sigma factor
MARETGELRMIEVVVRSPAASLELSAIGRELASSQLELGDVVRAHLGEDDGEEASQTLAALLAQLGRAAKSQKRRTALAATLARYRWAPKTVERLVTHLRSLPRSKDASDPHKTAKLVRAHYEEAEDARKELIRANMRLVIWIAKRKRDHGLALGDLVQEGNIGLMRAADKFDHRRGVRFSTYATWWIRQSVNRALSDQSRTIRLPVHLLEVKHKLEGARRRFTAHHGREPTAEELATATSIAMPRIRQVLDAPKQPLSMETPVGSEGDSTLGDVVSDQDLVSPIDHIVDQRLRATIGKLLTKLSPREQLVLKMRFGIDQSDGTTLQEVGNKLSVSRERIRQIESEALHKLRDQAEPEGLSSYLSA